MTTKRRRPTPASKRRRLITMSRAPTADDRPGYTTVGAPPTVSPPLPPPGYVAISPRDLLGFRPSKLELSFLSRAMQDLTRFTESSAVLGVTAPATEDLRALLERALAWFSAFADAEAWCAYVRSEEGKAWRDALEQLNRFRRPFQLASAVKPALATQYWGLTQLLGAQNEFAKQAAASRKKNAAARAKGETATATEGEAGTPSKKRRAAKGKR